MIYSISHQGNKGNILIGISDNKKDILNICQDYKYFGDYLEPWTLQKHKEMEDNLRDPDVKEFQIECFESDMRQSTPDIFVIKKHEINTLSSKQYMFIK